MLNTQENILLSKETLDNEYDRLLNTNSYSIYHPDILKREIYLESLMRQEGLLRELNNNEKAVQKKMESQTSYGTALLRKYVYILAKDISKLMDTIRTGKAGQCRSSLRYIKNMEDTLIAFITLKTVIDCISTIKGTASLQNIGFYIGKALENECRCNIFQKYAEKQYEMAIRKLKKRGRSRGKDKEAESLFGIMSRASKGFYGNTPNPDLVWELWPKSDKVLIGVKLLTQLADTTGLIQIKKASVAKGKRMYIVITNPETTDWIKQCARYTGLMSPTYLPTVIPPKSFTNPFNGGYHTDFVRHFPLVKVRDKAYFKSLSASKTIKDMSSVYNAVNTAQNTAWKINQPVYKVIKELWENEAFVDCLPRQDDIPIPPCPRCGKVVSKNHECFKEDTEAYKSWCYQAKEAHKRNKSNKSKALIIHRILWVAGLYKDEEAFYFPYQLDFRGRIYALPVFLNPQGSDVAKGLLTFAYGKPIENKEAANWLAIHIANCYGKDKLSFSERIAWVKNNSDLIQNIANNPMDTLTDWTTADSPFCFLAGCIEWDGYIREGYDYVSSLPIAIDGTCSGLQHYSAMLRDDVGGVAVNLTPSDKPSDIYGIVADRTIKKLKSITLTDDNVDDYELAQQWLNSGLLNRKITKRAVMTLPYGSTLFSAKDYIVDRMNEARDEEHMCLPWASQHETTTLYEFNKLLELEGVTNAIYDTDPFLYAGHWLGKYVWEAIGETVIAASEAMDWLKKCASLVVKNGRPVAWVSPCGLPVVQAYVNMKERQIKTTLNGSVIYDLYSKPKALEAIQEIRLDLTIKEDTDELNASKQRNGIAPNFVHSMDASAMMLAVNLAKSKYNIDSFALIHDSFATHASDTASLAKAIRESFVDMYETHDVLAEFEEQVKKVLPAGTELPSKPKRGTLDLKQVHDSLYFFS